MPAALNATLSCVTKTEIGIAPGGPIFKVNYYEMGKKRDPCEIHLFFDAERVRELRELLNYWDAQASIPMSR
jgi:hypothetical protein